MTATIDLPRTQGPGSGLGGTWRVIVRNDDHNTFDHVAEALASTIPGLNLAQGYALADRVHRSGLAMVWSGDHDLARDYARGQLSEHERNEGAQRHAAHYVRVLRRAEELYLGGGEAMLQGLALFDRERRNIEIGQFWAAMHWEWGGPAAELCSEYPNVGARCMNIRLQPDTRIAWFDMAIKAARRIKDRQAECNHLGNLGIAHQDLGDALKAVSLFDQQLVIAREIGDRRGEGNALGSLGIAYRNLKDPRMSIGFYEQQLAIVREIPDRRAEGNALSNLGIVYRDLGEMDNSIASYQQALVIFHESGDYLGEGLARHNLADVLAATGRHDMAIANAEQAVDILEQIESPHAAKARARLGELRRGK